MSQIERAKPRTLSVHDVDWAELKQIALEELGPTGRQSDALRVLIQRHRKARSERADQRRTA